MKMLVEKAPVIDKKDDLTTTRMAFKIKNTHHVVILWLDEYVKNG